MSNSKALATRIYACTVGDKVRLVRAQNRVQALNHVAHSMITVEIASQDQLVEAVTKGAAVETADVKTDTETRDIDFGASGS